MIRHSRLDDPDPTRTALQCGTAARTALGPARAPACARRPSPLARPAPCARRHPRRAGPPTRLRAARRAAERGRGEAARETRPGRYAWMEGTIAAGDDTVRILPG